MRFAEIYNRKPGSSFHALAAGPVLQSPHSVEPSIIFWEFGFATDEGRFPPQLYVEVRCGPKVCVSIHGDDLIEALKGAVQTCWQIGIEFLPVGVTEDFAADEATWATGWGWIDKTPTFMMEPAPPPL